jgi:hypothetical protein
MLLHLAGIWLKFREDVFNLIWFIVKKFYKFCIFNAICKDNATRNVLLFVTHKKRFISINFDCSYARLVISYNGS